MIVLVLLVAAMTTASGLLLALEPGPGTPASPPTLSVVEPDIVGPPSLWAAANDAPAAPWDGIAIHFSGQSFGSARMLGQLHERMGLGSLGYHLVIGNGSGSGDGELEIGYRWQRQLTGVSHVQGQWAGRAVIDVCLVGDGSKRPPTRAQMIELVRVVRKLQHRLNISPEAVYLYTDSVTGRGRLFPVAWFRQQLVSYD
jgi:N-acetylmuramoyl-L-alanine amidase